MCKSFFMKSTDGRLNNKVYDKRDDLTFPIVNCPFLGSSIPAAPAYGINILQLICFAEVEQLHRKERDATNQQTVSSGIQG